jgi:hypothetical protein
LRRIVIRLNFLINAGIFIGRKTSLNNNNRNVQAARPEATSIR